MHKLRSNRMMEVDNLNIARTLENKSGSNNKEGRGPRGKCFMKFHIKWKTP